MSRPDGPKQGRIGLGDSRLDDSQGSIGLAEDESTSGRANELASTANRRAPKSSASKATQADSALVYVQVAIDVPVDTAFTYAVPEHLAPLAVLGVRVLVPFRQRSRVGVVIGRSEHRPEGVARIRTIADVVDATPVVPEAQLNMLLWAARYYHQPVGEVVKLALPAETTVSSSRWLEAVSGAFTEEDARHLGETQSQLWELLRDGQRAMRPEELLALVRGSKHADLDALEAAGALTSALRTEGGKVRVKTETLITLVTRGAGTLGAIQQRVMQWLVKEKEATASDLRHHVGSTAAVIRSLEKRGLVATREEEVVRDPFSGTGAERRDADPILTEEQAAALGALLPGLDGGRGDVTQGSEEVREADKATIAMLRGVTGSGKTELYVRLLRRCAELGRRALVLLPEIALTPQLVGVFRSALDVPIAVLHSGLSPGERFDQWRQIRDGRVSLIIGARSALFAPIQDLGLIIVDEEHDPSFKQHEGVPYHARDLAVWLTHKLGALCVLGSATPSLETVRNAETGRYIAVELTKRVAGRPMPLVELIDMKDHPPGEGDVVSAVLSAPLQLAVREAARAGEQSILFMNRRGFAPSVQCSTCGTALECARCDVAMTYHRARNGVRCHYCGTDADLPEACPSCNSETLETVGMGTEQIEDVVDTAFADLRVARLDRDTARGRGLQRLLQRFRNHELDVLVGTQMVTKGHDFPKVTLVGVIDADQSLRFPDFRSGERTFQLLAQVAGRAGRADRPGRVLVQTWRPEHEVLQAVRTHDFAAFSGAELRFRERTRYPPFGHMVLLRFDAPDPSALLERAGRLVSYVRKNGDSSVSVQGPVDAPIARVRDRFRMHVILRGTTRKPIHASTRLALHFASTQAKDWAKLDVRMRTDVDPQSLL
ncbi:MAG: primosomal protein N' (replication factor Y) [Bradymonadia bacterium]|jgi:primosomal protein N' (replication factor Y)